MVESRSLRCAVVVAVIAFSLAFACHRTAPPDIRAERIVLISYDSVGADVAWRWIAEGTAASPDGLQGMADHGLSAERLRMVNPTLTAVQHVSLATGSNAAGTGVVSNLFRKPGTAITEGVFGFGVTSEAEPLWASARRHGMRVGVLMWPGADGRADARRGDFGVMWPRPSVSPSEILDLSPETAGTTGEVPSNDGLPPLMWAVSIDLGRSAPDRVDALVALVDADPNGVPRYDSVAVRLAGADDWSYAGEMDWLELEFEAQGPADTIPRRYGAWCKVLRIDRLTGGLRFYRGAVNRLMAYPVEFEDRLTEAIGPWPGEADRAVADWWLDLEQGIDLDTFIEQGERLDRYLDRMAEFVLAEEGADLVLAYHSSMDVYLHSCLITDPLQWSFSPGRALAAREGLKRMGRSVDTSIASMWRALDPERDALVVVSDHGQIPIFEKVRVNRVLAGAGLISIEEAEGSSRVVADSPMVALAAGAVAHVYLNLEGREPTGVVPQTEAGEYLRRAARAFAGLETEGRPAVEKIFTRDEAAEIGLDHPNSGDLVVFFAPGFAAVNDLDGEALEPSRYYGQHGYLASHDEMCGMLFARGVGIKRTRLGEVSATEVAPMVAGWLGIDPGGR